jgi:hypothetical protein
VTRNTHDMVNDHFGDLDDAQIASGSPSSGDVPASNGDGTRTWTTPSSGVALSNATPLVESGSGGPGTGVDASRDDHFHPASGSAVGNLWSMSLSSSQTLTNNTVTTITWDRSDIDGGGSVIDLANDRFVVPATGFYLVLFSWLWEGTAPLITCAMQINVGGTNVALLRVPGATAATAVFNANGGYNGTASLALTSGDHVTGAINPAAVTGVTARGNASRALSTVITLVRIT